MRLGMISKYMPHKLKDPSSGPMPSIESSTWYSVPVIPVLEKQQKQDSCGFLAPVRAESASSQFREKQCLK